MMNSLWYCPGMDSNSAAQACPTGWEVVPRHAGFLGLPQDRISTGRWPHISASMAWPPKMVASICQRLKRPLFLTWFSSIVAAWWILWIQKIDEFACLLRLMQCKTRLLTPGRTASTAGNYMSDVYNMNKDCHEGHYYYKTPQYPKGNGETASESVRSTWTILLQWTQS